MSGGIFGIAVPKADFSALANLGKGLSDQVDGIGKQMLARDLGEKVKAGDYAGAADVALKAGDLQTGLALVKLGENRGADKRFEQGLGSLFGGAPSEGGATLGNMAETYRGGPVAAPGGAAAYKTDDPVAENLLPHQKALLNGIAGGESAGKYNVRFTPRGGALFQDLSQHPNIAEMGPHGPSTAAGRYQFVKSTWDGLGGGDFSPANQDRRALQLAGQDYQARTGRDLDADLQAEGFSPRIQKALAPTWLALGSNAERHAATYAESLARYQGQGAAPARVATADADAANKPAEGAQTAQFAVPPGGGGGDAGAAPASTAASMPVSVQLVGAGIPRQDAVAVGRTQPGSPDRIKALIGLSLIPGLSEQRQGVVKTLLGYELDRSKEGGQIRAQIQAREAEVRARGLDPTEARNQQFILTGSRPEEKDDRTAEQKDYGAAKREGYTGMLVDFINMKGNANRAQTTINNAVNPVLKGLGDQFVESTGTARSSADVVRAVQSARSQVEAPGGIFSGALADQQLALQKLGAAIGVSDPSAIQNTETFRTQIKPIVLETVKGLGAGSGISNADKDFAEIDAPAIQSSPEPARQAAPDPAASGEQPRKPRPVVPGGKPPAGYTWESYLGKAKTTLKDRPDLRPQLEDMLADAGIDPRKLGK